MDGLTKALLLATFYRGVNFATIRQIAKTRWLVDKLCLVVICPSIGLGVLNIKLYKFFRTCIQGFDVRNIFDQHGSGPYEVSENR